MHSPRNSYLETQILTATPQRLRLMLIEGALRHGRAALDHWEEHRNEEAYESLVRCRAIVSELLGGVRAADSPLAASVSAVYLFLFQSLAEAQLERSPEKVAAAMKVLEIERETWRQLCEQMPEPPTSDVAERQPREITAAGLTTILPSSPPHLRGRGPHYAPATSRFSLEG